MMSQQIGEPRVGHWITKEAYSEDKAMGFTEQIVCSNCDMQNSYFSEWDECKNPISKTFIRSKFCPNCGAKMEAPWGESEEA
jgi:NADH pyrophosphatase NudC (nudix superfamily)